MWTAQHEQLFPLKNPQDIVVKEIFGPQEIEDGIEELAQSIIANFPDEDVVFVGLRTRGVTLAKRVAATLQKNRHTDYPVGTLDISLYRDDFGHRGREFPSLETSELPFEIDGKRVVLFDEVIYTGRTIRAALEGLIDYGRPARIELAVLVDRGLREIPIQPDYFVLRLDTTALEYVKVRFREDDVQEDSVVLESSKSELEA